jgi:hypothetical protein
MKPGKRRPEKGTMNDEMFVKTLELVKRGGNIYIGAENGASPNQASFALRFRSLHQNSSFLSDPLHLLQFLHQRARARCVIL